MVNVRGALMMACVDMFQNALMLLMALRILRGRIRLFRIAFAAFFGTAAAFATGYAPLSRGWQLLLSLPLAFSMMRIAAGAVKGFYGALRRTMTLLACAGFLGGVVLALEGALGSLMAAHAVSSVFAGAVFVGCLQAARAAQDTQRARVCCEIAGKAFEFEAIVDSGNSLRDYLTHRPVIVTGSDAEIMKALEEANTRLIFADTAGGKAMMRMVVPKETIIRTGNKQRHVRAALAFSPGMKAGMPALVPSALLEKEG